MALIRPTSFWRQVNPRGMVNDFVTVFHQAGAHRWRIAVLAAATTIGIFSVIWQEGAVGPPKRPKIDYIRTWAPHRTEAEILAGNVENQRRKDILAAEQARREEDVRQMYKTLGRMSGMDVDAIEQKAKADREAEARASAAAQQQTGQTPQQKAAPRGE